MKIQSYKKMTGSRYKVILDKNELIIYEDLILKYNLLLKHEITLDEIDKIMDENKYYEAYYQAVKYISIKMRSKKEIEEYLQKKEIDNLIINDVISKLIEQGLINNDSYIKAYINDKMYLNNYGPYKIKQELIKNDINEEDIDRYLNLIDNSIWKEHLTKLIKKKMSISKNLSTYKLKNKIMLDMYNQGYEKEMIEELLRTYDFNDNNALNKEYEKAYKKYSNKFTGQELYQSIKNYLYKKGFSLSSIQELLHEKTEL